MPFNKWLSIDVQERRNRIENLCQGCKSDPDLKPAKTSMRHFKCGNVYLREMTAQKDAIIVGKIHKKPQINIISKGAVVVYTDQGEDVIVAPSTFICPAGTRRAVVVLEEVVWATVHETESDDLGVIEEELIAKDYNALELHLKDNSKERVKLLG